jgi:uncharacterized FAD-dependent dehydrogenase
MSFDNEVFSISKNGKTFTIEAQLGDYECKKVILCCGRAGWDFTNEIYRDFDLIEKNNVARFGVRLEIADSYVKGFNGSNCTLIKDDIEIGPFSHNGTVIPEDCFEFALASYRSNEQRWESNNVSFNFVKHFEIENGYEQADRIAKLLFIISNDRVLKEKISSILSKRACISLLPKEYNWIVNEINELSNVIPEIINKGYCHIPMIINSLPKIKIKKTLETEMGGLHIAGECLGISGLLSAAISGIICATEVIK